MYTGCLLQINSTLNCTEFFKSLNTCVLITIFFFSVAIIESRNLYASMFSTSIILAGPGSFLVRPSDNSPGDYSLFFHINNQIQRFRIEKKGVRYLMGGRIFECLDAVINRYRKEQIVEGYTLQHPVKKIQKQQYFFVSFILNFSSLLTAARSRTGCRRTRRRSPRPKRSTPL